jgi:hypothetical protein
MNEPEGPSRLFRVWHNVLQMLSDRGYSVDVRLLAYSETEFEALCPNRSSMTLHVIHHEHRECQLRVLFVDQETIGEDKIRKSTIPLLLRRLGEREGTRGIFVFSDDLTMTPPAAKVIEAMNDETPGLLQYFAEEELVVNLVRRDYALGTRYECPTTHHVPTSAARNLGRIYERDRVARYYNAQPNDVIRITRRSETGGLAVSYKRVVPLDRDAEKYF